MYNIIETPCTAGECATAFPNWQKDGMGKTTMAVWKRGTQQQITTQETPDALHDFKEVVTFKLTGGWVRDEEKLSAKK
jgi:hypothetical protein